MKSTSSSSVRTSPIVAAVVKAVEVMPDWWSWRVFTSLSLNSLSWSSLSPSGPLTGHPDAASTLRASCAVRSGRPLTNVITTNVTMPPSAANPATSTSAAASPRGTLRAIRNPTAGARRAASSNAIASGTDGGQPPHYDAHNVERGHHE
ncbi:hypothetical protein SAMN05216553_101705 [Lentzea fradiae]|uniref:Uncharacterized protein n=1 Tax=Lentzea fradiae TaxID=200378 RepID=A0A1G7L6X0_9PSEU|nr:hypothetical protein SAMN05216553_101705 [Lentzea fradiae]